jgi:hydrogenase expression/formation protein HypC
MCVAYPARVLALGTDGTATVLVRGREQRVALLVVAGEGIGPGDWLLVQSGIALARMDEREAAARIRLIDQGTGELP